MKQAEYTGENWPTIGYGEGSDAPVFYRVCPICSRFVKADKQSQMPEYTKANATCKVHGRVVMPFCCWQDDVLDAESEEEKP
ncbi:MAG: hypothetical protein WC554_18010 [Clostridia bacterium]